MCLFCTVPSMLGGGGEKRIVSDIEKVFLIDNAS